MLYPFPDAGKIPLTDLIVNQKDSEARVERLINGRLMGTL